MARANLRPDLRPDLPAFCQGQNSKDHNNVKDDNNNNNNANKENSKSNTKNNNPNINSSNENRNDRNVLSSNISNNCLYIASEPGSAGSNPEYENPEHGWGRPSYPEDGWGSYPENVRMGYPENSHPEAVWTESVWPGRAGYFSATTRCGSWSEKGSEV
jgi:hypothetical protein